MELITKFQYQRLVEKIKELERRLQEVSEEAANAYELGDAIENAEFESAVKQEHLLTSRLSHLKRELNSYGIVDEKIDLSSVNICTTVRVVELRTRKVYSYNIVGSGPVELDHNEVSYNSIIGKALLGAKVGDLRKARIHECELELLVFDISKYNST